MAGLEANLLPAERARIDARPTEDLRAYHFYLRAREYHSRTGRPESGLRNEVRLYERALTEDPAFALGPARLSHAHSLI